MIVTASKIPVPDPMAPRNGTFIYSCKLFWQRNWTRLALTEVKISDLGGLSHSSKIRRIFITILCSLWIKSNLESCTKYQTENQAPSNLRTKTCKTYQGSLQELKEHLYIVPRKQRQWECICSIREPCFFHGDLSSTSVDHGAGEQRPARNGIHSKISQNLIILIQGKSQGFLINKCNNSLS